MRVYFRHPTFAFEFLRVLGESVYGGADINECYLTASRIKEGDYESWHQEWKRTAQRLRAIAEDCRDRGHGVSAREAFFRAANYFRCAEFFMHMDIGKTDPRALETYDQSVACFRQAIQWLPTPCEVVSIPFEGTTLPGYFFQVDDSGASRPTVIVHGGYDSTGEEQYFEAVPAALARGYHCLVFEGPGQGHVIRYQNLPFRPDWESVVTPVVDYALGRNEIDPARLALMGVSLGGLLAPRAAAFEHRLAACIAVDGVYGHRPADEHDRPGQPGGPSLEAQLRASEGLRWAISQGMWTLRARSLEDCLTKMQAFSLEGVAELITCPTLVCDAEGDHAFAGHPQWVFDALCCPKTYSLFTAEDAAEEHCHVGAKTLLNQRVFDWLDETLAGRRSFDEGVAPDALPDGPRLPTLGSRVLGRDHSSSADKERTHE